MKKIDKPILLWIILVLIVCIGLPFISADEQYKVGIPINLQYTCTLNNAIPDPSTTFNISIYYQNGTYLVNNKQATSQGQGSFNYTVTFNESGNYKVNMFCLNPNYNYSSTGNYIISPTGTDFNTVQISIYIFFFLLCLVITYFSFKLFKENKFSKDVVKGKELYEMKKRNEFMFYMQLLKGKLWIVGVFGIYLSILLFVALLSQLVYNLGLTDINSVLFYVVIGFTWGLIPFTLFWFIWLIIVFYKSTEEILKYQFGNIGREK